MIFFVMSRFSSHRESKRHLVRVITDTQYMSK